MQADLRKLEYDKQQLLDGLEKKRLELKEIEAEIARRKEMEIEALKKFDGKNVYILIESAKNENYGQHPGWGVGLQVFLTREHAEVHRKKSIHECVNKVEVARLQYCFQLDIPPEEQREISM